MSTIKYHYAYNETQTTVDIKDVTPEDRARNRFFCIGCGAEMVAKLGKKNAHHFAHKRDESCNTETYLHKLAKKMLKKKFDESHIFEIEYKREVTCSKCTSCPFYNEKDCYEMIPEKFNLKEFYNICIEEEKIGNYRADLLLKNEENNDPPILIEIHVTHESTYEKLNSNYKIIEISIQTEDDIRKLMTHSISENENDPIFFNKNFKRKSNKTRSLGKKRLSRFCLFKRGETFVPNIEYISCNDEKKNQEAALELRIDSYTSYYQWNIEGYDFGIVKARQMGYEIKNCSLCEHIHIHNISKGPISCKLSFEKSLFPDLKNDIQCPYFKLNSDRVKKIEQSMPPIKRV